MVPGAVHDEVDEAGGIDGNPPRLSEKSAFQRVICLLRYSGRGKSCESVFQLFTLPGLVTWPRSGVSLQCLVAEPHRTASRNSSSRGWTKLG